MANWDYEWALPATVGGCSVDLLWQSGHAAVQRAAGGGDDQPRRA